MGFDFADAQLPRLLPLDASFTENDIEADLKCLFIDLFRTHLAAKAFDANVLGAAHLGSFDLVRRAVNADGLVLLQGDREESATRYLYRAWKSGDGQGRGLHFLRTYLQLLFPNSCEVEQLWHSKAQPYPTALTTLQPSLRWWLHQVGEPGLKLDGSWGLGRRIAGAGEERRNRKPDSSGFYLTSRILISLDFEAATHSIASLMHILRSILPARLLPDFRFWLRLFIDVPISFSGTVAMKKRIVLSYPWCGRVITSNPARRWQLGYSGAFVKLPQPFGSFRVGERRGRKVEWWLTSCRIVGRQQGKIRGEARVWRVETLPPTPAPAYRVPDPPQKLFRRVRRLDGSWTLGGVPRLGHFRLDGRRLRGRKMARFPPFGTFKIITHRPPEVLSPPPARLTLSGRWKLGGPKAPVFTLETIK